MAEKDEKQDMSNDEKGSCGSKRCCGGCCVAGKVLGAALLLLLGGILGFLMAGNCHSKKMCGMMSQPCPMMGSMPSDNAPKK